MAEVEKPRRKPGLMCPLFRQDVSEVCHTCELYGVIPVAEADRPTKVFDQWGCAFNHAVTVNRSMVTVTDEMGASLQKLRNAFVKAEKMHLRLLGVVSGDMNGHVMIEGETTD